MQLFTPLYAWIKKHWPMSTLLVIVFILQIFHILRPAVTSWDGSVYVGMGKYLYSLGHEGVWEVLRPIAWPIILGFSWKIGLNPYTVGVWLVLLFSLLQLSLVYYLGEKIQKNAGIVAAALLACTPIFFGSSVVPMTDISSVALVLLSLVVLLEQRTIKNIFIAGIIAGLACMFRFPQGLMLVSGILIIAIDRLFNSNTEVFSLKIKQAAYEIFMFGIGFLVFVGPFLIANLYFYHDAFLPFKEGAAIVANSPELYAKGFSFYFIELFKQNIWIVAALIPLFLVAKRNRRLLYVYLHLIVFLTYFLYQLHKEIRYSLGFFPYIILLSGIGIAYVWSKFKIPAQALISILLIAIVYCGYGVINSEDLPNKPMEAFVHYFSGMPTVRLISSTPFEVSHSRVLLTTTLYDDWTDALHKYELTHATNDYIALNSCVLEIGCTQGSACMLNKGVLLMQLNAKEQKVFATTTPDHCELSIYKLSK